MMKPIPAPGHVSKEVTHTDTLRPSSFMKLVTQALLPAILVSAALLASACAASSADPPLRPPEAMRPPSSEPLLQALVAAPRDPTAHAAAALAYADGEASGMTLLWGLTYAALGGDADSGPRVAGAMTRVLNEHIVLSDDEGEIRLAPGAMPISLRADGSMAAPVIFIFELAFGGAAILHATGDWTLAEVQATLAEYVASTRNKNSGLEPHVELHAWLRALTDAGHLDAFVAESFGPAFEAEYADYISANPTAVSEARTWMASHPFEPSHAVLPDDLVDMVPGEA